MYVLALIITTVAVVISVKYIIPLLQSKTSLAEQEEVMKWVKIAVEAAEQLYPGTSRGAEKKTYALSILDYLGIDAQSKGIDAMVEAGVFKLDGNSGHTAK